MPVEVFVIVSSKNLSPLSDIVPSLFNNYKQIVNYEQIVNEAQQNVHVYLQGWYQQPRP